MRAGRLGSEGPSPEEQAILDAEPEQDEQVGMCLTAWRDLSTERPIGFGVAGPIPQSKVWAWAERKGLDEETAEILWAVICRLDNDRARRETSKAKLEAANKGAPR